MIELANLSAGAKVLELGGGDNPHPAATCNVDVRPGPRVHFTHDLTVFPWPLMDAEWDVVHAAYVLEHVPYAAVPAFLNEAFRVTKPGGRVVFVLPNTDAQVRWVADHPQGWDGKDFFVAASELLFGSQNMPGPGGADANTHKAVFTPVAAEKLFATAGFVDIKIDAYNERGTDMVVVATKPLEVLRSAVSPGMTAYRMPHELFTDAAVAQTPQEHTGKEGWIERQVRERAEELSKPTPAGPDPAAGFANVQVEPYNERGTDMVVVATRPAYQNFGTGPSPIHRGPSTHAAVAQTPQEHRPGKPEVVAGPTEGQGAAPTASHPPLQLKAASIGFAPAGSTVEPVSREQLFDKAYFNGGGKVGGYAREGYWDYPAHEVTARHVLDRRPESVLELGCARGYVVKRLQDAGVRAFGLEISRHCYMTRVCDSIKLTDVCQADWGSEFAGDNPCFDLCFSIATLEHVPEEHLPAVIAEMARTCRRGLHGIDFGENDDGFDQTHCTLHDRAWWLTMFAKHAPGWPVEIIDKERLENAELLPEGAAAFWEGLRRDDGLIKLNVGSFTTMFHRHWENIDAVDLLQFAANYGYHYSHSDVRGGLHHATGSVHLIYTGHMLEHLDYDAGLTFLRECRRVLRPDGAMRIIVPDAELLARRYLNGTLDEFDEINDPAAGRQTTCAKYWSLLCSGHQSAYDWPTLEQMLRLSGFAPYKAAFRQTQHQPVRKILAETLDVLPCLSLYVDALPELE